MPVVTTDFWIYLPFAADVLNFVVRIRDPTPPGKGPSVVMPWIDECVTVYDHEAIDALGGSHGVTQHGEQLCGAKHQQSGIRVRRGAPIDLRAD